MYVRCRLYSIYLLINELFFFCCCMCVSVHVCYTHTHTLKYTHLHTRARAHTHTHTHTHACILRYLKHTHIRTHTTRIHINICMTSIYSSLAHFVLLPEVLLPPTQALSQSLSVRLQTCMLWERLSTPLLRHGVAVTKNDQFSPSV